MKPRYIIISIVILAFVVLAIMSFQNSTIDYSDFAKAKKGDKVVQVICELTDKDKVSYDEEKNELTFWGEDEEGATAKVVFAGSKPNNFDIAPHLVVKGKFESNVFQSTEILTKCPSKYDSAKDELLQQEEN